MSDDVPGVFVDASPLIALALIAHLDLLLVLRQAVWVTMAVWEEVAGDPKRPGAEALFGAEKAGILTLIDAGDRLAYPMLGPGESTVLSAAAGLGAHVIVDDLRARVLIARDPYLRTALPSSFTTMSLLLFAKRQRAIDAVRPLLDALRQAGYGIDDQTYGAALKLAGEVE